MYAWGVILKWVDNEGEVGGRYGVRSNLCGE
jgi:hypothetical protein